MLPSDLPSRFGCNERADPGVDVVGCDRQRRRNPKASQMKFRFLALGLVATLASVASAHVLLPLPEKTGVLPHSTEQAQPPSKALPSQVSSQTARNTVASDSGRAPVPVLFSPRREFVPAVAAASTPSLTNADAAAPGNIAETAAKAAIEADGYKGVRALARGSDGTWKAIALRGKTEVSLTVDPTGSVSAN